MTDKEAISELEEFRNFKHTYYGNAWFKVEVCADDEMKGKIDKIINLIQAQQEEIEILKQEKATAWEEWNILNEYCEQEEQKYKAEIEKKDKIIDEMAEYLYEDDNIFGFGIFKEINTPEKIKEYFKKKVEGI